jgi:hypothetical protein
MVTIALQGRAKQSETLEIGRERMKKTPHHHDHPHIRKEL